MKNSAFLFIPLVSVISFGCFAQSNDHIPANSEKRNTPSNLSNNEELVIVSYHVVENVRGNITTYDVSNINLIDKNNLGPNSTRVVTPKYGKAKVKPKEAANSTFGLQPISFDTTINPEKLIKVEEVAPPLKKLEFVMVDILSTYERILDKGGYESAEMLKKVANMRYFKGDLVVAYKWYSQLFALTNDFEIVYYYRYAQALKAVGQANKANEMMKIFENKKVSK